jgi:hypothetical protein
MISQRATHSPERGHTLLEVAVAATLFVLFVVGLYSTSSIFLSLLDVQKHRTEALTAMGVARSRIVSDARGVSSAACAGSDTLELRTTGGGPPYIVEYSSDGERLLRWVSDQNKTYWVADGVGAVECSSLGSDGVDLSVTFGRIEDRFALHVSLLDLPGGS